MKKLTVLIIFFLVIQLIQADDTEDPIWKKAGIIAKENSNLVPGELRQIARQTNKKGKVKSEESLLIRYEKIGEQVEAIYVSGERDGETMPEDDERVQSVLNENVLDNSSLFNNFQGNDLKVTKTSEFREIKGYNCLAFNYEFNKIDEEDNKISVTGKVWLEEENGIPLLNEAILESSKKVVKDMKVISHYHYGEDGWYMNEVYTSFRISLILMSIYIEMDRFYQNYWEYEPINSETSLSD